MKKTIALIALGSSIFTTSVAMAAPVELTGETSIKYVHEKQEGSSTQSGMVYTLKLMAQAEVNNYLSVYTRFGAQNSRQPQLGDFNPDAYPDRKSAIAIDQYGLIFKQDKLEYKLGRQNATVGATALLYSRPDTNIGKNNFVDGLSISGTAGVMDITALLAREDNVTNDNNRVYAIRTGYNPTDNLNLGVTIGRFQSSSASSTNHWAVDGTYKYGKNSWTAEFTNSSYNTDNKAFALAWSYDVDNKTAFTVTGFRVEAHGDMGGQSDFGNNVHGIHYGVTHSFKDNINAEFIFKDEKSIDNSAKTKRYETTLNYTF